jgi:putative tricarboxylic transport membrane protein
MSEHVRDRIVGAILIVFAAAWCIVVWKTVPTGYGEALVGPRDVPLWLGIVLGLLALALIGNSYIGAASPEAEEKPAKAPDRGSEWQAFATVAGSLLAYALLMEWFGFVIATVVFLVAVLRFALDVRSLKVILGMSLVMSFGIYFVMGGLMGVYLPRGAVISPF